MKRDEEIMFIVTSIIAEQFGIHPDEISLETSFEGDLDADPLDYVELALALGEEYDIEIGDGDLKQSVTVGEVVTYLVNRTA